MNRKILPGAFVALLLTFGLVACGDDGDDAKADDPPAAETAGAADADAPEGDDGADEGSEAGSAAGGTVIEVTAVDFDFEDLPDSVEAGTRLVMHNDAESELHELVAFRLDDDETRSIEEIIALDPEAMEAVLGPPTTVILAPPGGDQVATPVGDGTLDEPGRYAIVCFIPTGVDPDEYLAAAASGEQPDLDGGPPHFVHGMYAEIDVR